MFKHVASLHQNLQIYCIKSIQRNPYLVLEIVKKPTTIIETYNVICLVLLSLNVM